VADAGGLDLDQNFARARSFQIVTDNSTSGRVGSVLQRLANRRSQEMHGDVMIRHRQSMRGAPGSSFTVK
jgi:predicted Fe-Mo cluster-binding NifX family protein